MSPSTTDTPNFSTNSLALILASTPYDPADYIEDYDLYRQEYISKDSDGNE